MSDFPKALREEWIHASSSTVNTIAEVYQRAFSTYGLYSPLIICHFMAQLSQECGCGRITRESMYYSQPRIMEIFGVGKHSAKVTEQEASSLAGNEEALAERVYGLGNPGKAKELGNTQKGDGFKFRGNGLLQLTGRGSHKRIGKLIGLDLENHPELLEDPRSSFLAACAEFQDLGAIPFAEKDDIRGVTKKVNGGTNGLAERIVYLKRWKKSLDGIEAPAVLPRAAPDASQTTLLGSKITQAGIGTGVVSTLSVGSQLIQTISTTTDQVTTTQDNVKHVLSAVRPFMGLDPHTWKVAAITFGLCSMAGCGVVLWQRYKKLRDQGV